MNSKIDVEQIRDKVIERRIAWNEPTYGQNFLDAIQTLKHFNPGYTIIDEYMKYLGNIKKHIDAFLLENRGYVVYDILTFVQSWPTTSLGFNSFGGDAITDAITTVVLIKNDKFDKLAYVYFNGKFAYGYPLSKTLLNDVKDCRMASCNYAHDRYTISDKGGTDGAE